VWIPDEIVERLAKTPKPDKGRRVSAFVLNHQQVREIEVSTGFTLCLSPGRNRAEIIHRCLFPRRPVYDLPQKPSRLPHSCPGFDLVEDKAMSRIQRRMSTPTSRCT